jgi:alcohol dehydrogenase class IV
MGLEIVRQLTLNNYQKDIVFVFLLCYHGLNKRKPTHLGGKKMANLFFIPQYIITGENALKMSMEYLKTFGKKALIVTDDVMVKLNNVKKLTDELDQIQVSYIIYSGINCEPTHTMIDEGVEIYKREGCDFLIGIGGGSPLDAMKAIGAVVTNGGSITEYMGKKIEHELPPTCVIPTTAGTVPKPQRFPSSPIRIPE